MLQDLPVHTRQSLYRCLDVTTENWIENEPEITWAKYTSFEVDVAEGWTDVFVNDRLHGLFGIPATVFDDGSATWYRNSNITQAIHHLETNNRIRITAHDRVPMELFFEGHMIRVFSGMLCVACQMKSELFGGRTEGMMQSFGPHVCDWVRRIIDINRL